MENRYEGYDIVDQMIGSSTEAIGVGMRATGALVVPILKNIIEIVKYPAAQMWSEGLRKADKLGYNAFERIIFLKQPKGR